MVSVSEKIMSQAYEICWCLCQGLACVTHALSSEDQMPVYAK